MADLPPQRVYRLFEALAADRVNNRRTRAVIRRYLGHVRDLHFDAVEYRRRVGLAARHAHAPLDPETSRFLRHSNRRDSAGQSNQAGRFTVPLFDAYSRSRFSKEALFELPLTVAEGLAASKGVSHQELLRRSEATMTAGERLRVQARAGRVGAEIAVDLAKAPLTRLATYVCSIDPAKRADRRDELDGALRAAADRAYRRVPAPLGRIAVVADRSFSTRGSYAKRHRTLAVTLATVHLLARAAEHCTVFWAPDLSRSHLEVTSRGQTDLATPVLAALDTRPELVVIVSDGYENAPVGLAAQTVAAARRIPELAAVSFVHVNPVFDADNLAPRPLGPALPTVGIRGAEDVLVMLGFARFADGSATLADLDAHLGTQARAYIERTRERAPDNVGQR